MLYERCGADPERGSPPLMIFEREAEALAAHDRYHRGPRACSSVDRASASGAEPPERSGHPRGTPSETGGVLRSRQARARDGRNGRGESAPVHRAGDLGATRDYGAWGCLQAEIRVVPAVGSRARLIEPQVAGSYVAGLKRATIPRTSSFSLPGMASDQATRFLLAPRRRSAPTRRGPPSATPGAIAAGAKTGPGTVWLRGQVNMCIRGHSPRRPEGQRGPDGSRRAGKPRRS